MTRKIRIEGMKCTHCQQRMKKALEAIDGIKSADVIFESGEAVLELEKDVSNAIIADTVKKAGFSIKAD
ncbi:MAG: heavy metal-associated domain-containing protein [Firmicutes bacterium]|nr:heavy metal-associated domain-containing protein [Bacillota bacterium]